MLNEDQAFALLKRRIFHDRGLDTEQYKENYLKRRVAVRLRATGATDYLDYIRMLRVDPDEYTRLMNELTINVTQFFRDADVYERLRGSVLPSLVEAKKSSGTRSIRIWSAGCASGEEPYSIVILLDKLLGTEGRKWNLRVLGSDIDDPSLARAREARYADLEMLPGIDAEEYFQVTASGESRIFRVRDEVKRRVRFEKVNLLADTETRHFDMVLCRNVLIYFGRKVQTTIIENLSRTILRDGFLVLGKSETLGPEASQMFKPVFPRERIYQVLPETRQAGGHMVPGNAGALVKRSGRASQEKGGGALG